MTQISDDFNRADSTNLGANWAEDAGNWEIASNTLNHQTNPGSSYSKLRWVGTALGSNDYDVEADCQSNNAVTGVGVLARGATSATNTFYGLIAFGGDAAYIVEITAGSENILSTGGSFPSGTSVNLRLSVSGSSLEGFQNDVSDVTATDSSLPAGDPGICGFGFWNATGRTADNFFADDFLNSSSSLILPRFTPWRGHR